MSKSSKLPIILGLYAVLALSACTKSSDNDASDDFIELDNAAVTAASFTTDCGVVVEGQLENPVDELTGVLVDVMALNSDLVVVTRKEGDQAGNQQLVKLHGITSAGVDETFRQDGLRIINTEFGSNSRLFIASSSDDCSVAVDGGGRGVFGQILSASGRNLNETLVNLRAALAGNDPCGGDLVVNCYSAIADSLPELRSPSVVSNFLWKPQSERDGNLVVLLNPSDVRVVANGTTLTNTGFSNGRGTTARANRSGCSFGANVRVEFFDREGLPIPIGPGADAPTSIVIPNGCNRVERS